MTDVDERRSDAGFAHRRLDEPDVLQHVRDRCLGGEVVRDELRALDARHVARQRSGIDRGNELRQVEPVALGEMGRLREARYDSGEKDIHRKLHE